MVKNQKNLPQNQTGRTRSEHIGEVDSDQIDRFKQAARELECDDDPKAFEKRVAEIARAKPKGKG